MSRKKRRDVQNTEEEKSSSLRKVVLDFSLDTVWVSVRCGKFTNYLKDDDQYFIMNKEIFKTILPIIGKSDFKTPYQFLDAIQKSGLPKSHLIEEEEKIELIKDVLKAIMVKNGKTKEDAALFVEQIIAQEKVYQIGFKSIRIIGLFKENIFTVLMVDYHHLIYPSKYHNQEDYERYRLCPIERGGNS